MSEQRFHALARFTRAQWSHAVHPNQHSRLRRSNAALQVLSRAITTETRGNQELAVQNHDMHLRILTDQTGARLVNEKDHALLAAMEHCDRLGLLSSETIDRVTQALTTDPNEDDPWVELAQTTPGVDQPQRVLNPEIAAAVLGPQALLPHHWDDTHMPYLGAVMLDSGASTLMLGPVRDTLLGMLPFYANTHSEEYRNAQAMNGVVHDAESNIRRYFGVDDSYGVFLEGSGATWGSNYVAANLALRQPNARVLYDLGSHHANILPWRRFNAEGVSIQAQNGKLDLQELERKLRTTPTDLVAVTAVSNVDGSINDIRAIREILDRYQNSQGGRILLFVDGAHSIHIPVNMQQWGADFITISGHKMYAPGSPGILIGRKDFFPNGSHDRATYGGGGPIIFVGEETHHLSQSVALPGTPNIPGHALIGAAIQQLEYMGGPQAVWEHEAALTTQYLDGIRNIEGVHILGDDDFNSSPRAGVVSLYLDGIPAAMAARVMGDLFAIYYRDGCVCAHPKVMKQVFHEMDQAGLNHRPYDEYVERVLGGNKEGLPMILRHSMAVYTRADDVARAIAALRWMMKNKDWIHAHYRIDEHGHVVRIDGQHVIVPKILH